MVSSNARSFRGKVQLVVVWTLGNLGTYAWCSKTSATWLLSMQPQHWQLSTFHYCLPSESHRLLRAKCWSGSRFVEIFLAVPLHFIASAPFTGCSCLRWSLKVCQLRPCWYELLDYLGLSSTLLCLIPPWLDRHLNFNSATILLIHLQFFSFGLWLNLTTLSHYCIVRFQHCLDLLCPLDRSLWLSSLGLSSVNYWSWFSNWCFLRVTKFLDSPR